MSSQRALKSEKDTVLPHVAAMLSKELSPDLQQNAGNRNRNFNYKKSLFIHTNTSFGIADSKRRSEIRGETGLQTRKRLFDPHSVGRLGSEKNVPQPEVKGGLEGETSNYCEFSPKMRPLSKHDGYQSLSKLAKKFKDPAFRTLLEIKAEDVNPKLKVNSSNLRFCKEEAVITVSKSANCLKTTNNAPRPTDLRKSMEGISKAKSPASFGLGLSKKKPTIPGGQLSFKHQQKTKDLFKNVTFSLKSGREIDSERRKSGVGSLIQSEVANDDQYKSVPMTKESVIKKGSLFQKFFFKVDMRPSKRQVQTSNSHLQQQSFNNQGTLANQSQIGTNSTKNHLGNVQNMSSNASLNRPALGSRRPPSSQNQRHSQGKMSPRRLKKLAETVAATDLNLLVQNEEFIYQFLECFNMQADLFELFNKYIEWVEQHDFQQFLDLIAIGQSSEPFKTALICERMALLIIFYLYTKGLYRTEIIFIKKVIGHVYRNFQELVKALNLVLTEGCLADKIPTFPARNFANLGSELPQFQVETNNEKILKILEVEIQSEERDIFEAFNKLRHLMEDFTLNESWSYFKATFIATVS